MKGPNQLDVTARGRAASPRSDLLAVPTGTSTEAGLRHNIHVGVQYLEAWLRGTGCVPLYNLMEDAATAEISRAQVWQWIHHRATLDDGRAVTAELFRRASPRRCTALREAPRGGALRRGALRRRHRALRAASPPRRCSTISSPCRPTRSSPRAPRRHPVAPRHRPQGKPTRAQRDTPPGAPHETTRQKEHPHVRSARLAARSRTATAASTASDAEPITKEPLTGRWDGIVRPYGAEDVAVCAARTAIEHTLADLGARRLWHLLKTEPYVDALGALTGNQAVQRSGPGSRRSTCRAGRWPPTTTRPRPDVPRPEPLPREQRAGRGPRINNALLRADQIEHAEGKAAPSWLVPIVADAEAGFGGPLNAFELMKAMIEAGAAGVHFEDQLASEKKCGHMGGKVLVPTSPVRPHAGRRAPRRRRVGVPTVLVARTDADSAKLLTRDIDPRDRAFLTGERTQRGLLRDQERRGDRHRARPRLRALRRHALVRDLDAGPRRGQGASPRASTPSSRASCSPTTARRRSTGRSTSTTPPSPSSSASSAPWATSSSSSRWPASTPSTTGCSSSPATMAGPRHGGVLRAAAARVRRGGAGYTATRHQREVGTGYFDQVAQVVSGGLASTLALAESTEAAQF